MASLLSFSLVLLHLNMKSLEISDRNKQFAVNISLCYLYDTFVNCKILLVKICDVYQICEILNNRLKKITDMTLAYRDYGGFCYENSPPFSPLMVNEN